MSCLPSFSELLELRFLLCFLFHIAVNHYADLLILKLIITNDEVKLNDLVYLNHDGDFLNQ